MRLRGMTKIEEQKKLMEKKRSTVNTRHNDYYEKSLFILKYAIYQSGPLDLPPGGWNTRTLVCTFF